MASGVKIQTAIRQKSEDMGPVCSDRHLCAHARMVNRYAAGCKEVQVVAGFPRLVAGDRWAGANPIVVSDI